MAATGVEDGTDDVFFLNEDNASALGEEEVKEKEPTFSPAVSQPAMDVVGRQFRMRSGDGVWMGGVCICGSGACMGGSGA